MRVYGAVSTKGGGIILGTIAESYDDCMMKAENFGIYSWPELMGMGWSIQAWNLDAIDPKSLVKIDTVNLPDWSVCYLVNGDSSGLDDEQIAQCDAWERTYSLPIVLDVCEKWGEGYIEWNNMSEFGLCGGPTHQAEVFGYEGSKS